MSDFNWSPAPGFAVQNKPRTVDAQFGDGYSASAPDGLNALNQTWPLRFAGPVAYIDAIDAFLKSKGGAASFTWTPYGGAEVRVVCKSWSVRYPSRAVRELEAEFVRVYR